MRSGWDPDPFPHMLLLLGAPGRTRTCKNRLRRPARILRASGANELTGAHGKTRTCTRPGFVDRRSSIELRGQTGGAGRNRTAISTLQASRLPLGRRPRTCWSTARESNPLRAPIEGVHCHRACRGWADRWDSNPLERGPQPRASPFGFDQRKRRRGMRGRLRALPTELPLSRAGIEPATA
jgi:hypothetical protein